MGARAVGQTDKAPRASPIVTHPRHTHTSLFLHKVTANNTTSTHRGFIKVQMDKLEQKKKEYEFICIKPSAGFLVYDKCTYCIHFFFHLFDHVLLDRPLSDGCFHEVVKLLRCSQIIPLSALPVHSPTVTKGLIT